MPKANQVSKYTFDHPAVFDVLHQPRFEPECVFLTRLFQAKMGIERILDVACGTGAHAAMLATQGFSVTGVDLNPNMLAYARTQHSGLGNERLAFIQGDMRELTFKEAFDAVICLCTSFSYNTTNEQIVAALQGFRRALRNGGMLVIDVFNPIDLIEKRSFSPELKEQQRHGLVNLVSSSQVKLDASRQLLIERRTISNKETGQLIQTDTTEFRLFFPQEFKYLLDTNGFQLEDFYSAFDLEQKNLDGSRLITVSIKK